MFYMTTVQQPRCLVFISSSPLVSGVRLINNYVSYVQLHVTLEFLEQFSVKHKCFICYIEACLLVLISL